MLNPVPKPEARIVQTIQKRDAHLDTICKRCGKAFRVPLSRSISVRFCSYECRYRFPMRSCSGCSKAFRPKSQRQRCCSKACRKPAAFGGVTVKYCKRCGAAFRPRHRTEMPFVFLQREFCSLSCSRAAASETFSQRRVSVQQTCAQCGKQFTAQKPSRTAKRRFCSHICSSVYLVQSRPNCPVCGKPRKRTSLTCGESCGYTFRKLRLRKPKPCVWCHQEFWPRVRSNKYCSAKCHRSHNPTFRGGPVHERNYRGKGWAKLAAAIRQRDQYTCRRCGRSEAENGQALSVDHIIPWRAFVNKDDANAPENLASVCRRCHAIKTHDMERKWLNGDRIGMEQYRAALQAQPVIFNGRPTPPHVAVI